ncbi:hypothetical protein EON65_03875 [archaeon]|nr:MAG: hypothetical protein EON65_03875 [archaeon]
MPSIRTSLFHVAVGNPSILTIEAGTDPSDNPIYGGEFFGVPPAIIVRDAGGNHIVRDNSSAVEIRIDDNPYRARIGPAERLFVIARRGKVQFTQLHMDKLGHGYTFKFILHTYSSDEGRFTETEVSVKSRRFNVLLGPARKLVLHRPAGGAWAGQQGFWTQPQLFVTDHGNNVVSTDFSTEVTMQLVTSLAVDKQIVIDTSAAPQTQFSNVYTNWDLGIGYGVGDELIITINCPYHVTVIPSSSGGMPYLSLNISSSDPSISAIAPLFGDYFQTRQLQFIYIVQPGDGAIGLVNILLSDSMYLNGSQVIDGNKNLLDITIPDHNSSYLIQSSTPVITALSCNTTSGEYGAGQVIRFSVSFDQPVTVRGSPYLLLTVNSSYSVNNNGTTSTVYVPAIANFSATSDDGLDVYFDYLVLDGQYSYTNLTLATSRIMFYNLTLNTTVVQTVNYTMGNETLQTYSYPYGWISVGETWLRRRSTYPTLDVNGDFSVAVLSNFISNSDIAIDTTRPKLDIAFGVRTNMSDGVYYPGDKIWLYVKYDKPIAWYGVSLLLRLFTGPSMTAGSAFVQALLDDQRTLEFMYVVRIGDNVSRLDIGSEYFALDIVANESYVKRLSTFPTTEAEFVTADIRNGNTSLRDTAALSLYGQPLKPLSVTLSTNPFNASQLIPDNSILLSVTFDGPVIANCAPVIVLSLNYYREAVYVSGNGTNTFVFMYNVSFGDEADFIGYRSIPTGLCSTSRCPYRTSCSIFSASDDPSLEIDYRLPRVNSMSTAFILSNTSIVSTTPLRNTTILQVSFLQDAGEYGSGSVLEFAVHFSDIVVVLGSDHPRLLLNIGEYADYVRGSYDDKLIFRYITTEDDVLTATDLKVEAISGHNTAILCDAACSIINQAEKLVDLTMDTSILSTSSGIFIDPSNPVVTDVYFEFENSRSVYSAGDLIKLVVITSKPVIVGGANPSIQLDLRPSNPSALYSAQLSSSTKLVFTYRSRVTEKSTNLSYISREINMMDDFTVILRLSSIPITPMNVSLPPPIHTPILAQSIDIDSRSSPVVLEVTCRNASGTYAVGDILVLEVQFSLDVIAMGRSRIALNMGDHAAYASYAGYVPRNCTNCTEDWVSSDFNSSSALTRTLLYQYMVGVNDATEKLDYIDAASYELLLTANNDPSYIKRVNHPVAVDADLSLPLPGSQGSISFSSPGVQVDGRQPYAISLRFITPSGIYSVNSSILIAMEFSAPVVVYDGVPSILLETGAIKNEAFYVNGSGTTELIFEYVPEPGDYNLYLDYYALRTAVNEASSSFLYNGASILAYSQWPSLAAHVYLNPPGGFLKGDVTAISDAGVVLYNDTYISRKGSSYELIYNAVIENRPQSLLNSQSIYVSFSSEYQLRPEAALKEERIGHAVDLQGDIAILGAPDFNVSVSTVQVVEISVADGLPRREVQTVQTNINPQPAVQTFYTTAGIDQAVGGYFTISFGLYGPTQPIASNADASTLLAILGYDMAVLGAIEVSRTRYDYCACENAYSWTITFSDYNVGTMDFITIDGSLLTGVGARISQPVMLQNPSLLSGSFRLSALGKKSTLIPFDASVALMKSSIEQTGLSVYAVTSSPTLKDRTRSWSVTFDAYQDSYEVPLLTTDFSGLSGGPGVSVSVTTALPGRHGPKGIAGYFQLQWRGNTTTTLLPNATAAEVKASLEALPIINTVNVNRTLLHPDIGAYSWTIDFLSVNYHNSRGYYHEEISNLEPIVPVNNLIATDATINVDAKWEIGSQSRITSKARLGTFGEGAGAVFVYQRLNDSWIEIATLRGNDTAINNKFGSSVAIDHDMLAIGAIGANRNGLPEKQSLHCNAMDGYFYVSFRGWSSGLISCNATREDLVDAVVSPSANFDKVHAITALEVDDWGGGPLCANNTAVLTFYGPIDGAENLFGIDAGANLELITLTDYNLTTWGSDPVLLEAAEVQRGTWVLHGNKADSQQVGAVYIFRLQNNCTVLNQTRCLKDQWVQEAQFFPPAGATSTHYGFSVELEDNVLVVGAPGSTDNSGLVYLYEYIESDKAWRYIQVLKDPANERGSRFGHTVAKSGTTVVITSSNLYTHTGEAYVYIRSTATGPFVATQFITSGSFSAVGTLFGADAAVLGNVLVVGVPGFNSSSVYLGDSPASSARSNSGAVLVFQRTGVTSNYLLKQVLTPSNVGEFTNFGAKVSVDNNVVIASSLEDYAGPLGPSKPVVSIKTKAAYNLQRLGGSFRLQFGKANSSDGMSPALVSRQIPYNALDVDLKYILEADFPVGELIVTRSRVDPYDGGYEWLVTFMRYPYEASLFSVDISTLSGTNASVEVTWVNPNPVKLRSNVHFFERASSSSNFVEQVYLHPYKHQHMDMCGFDLAISGQYALVGCPNRDQDVPNRHCGVGFIYDLSLLSLKFSQHSFAVKEGDNAVFPVEKDILASVTTDGDVSYYALTLDRNADNDMQMFIADLFSVANSSLWLGRETILDHTELVGKAFARRQFYGSSQEHHRWVDGRYDYRAISDYVPKVESFTTLSEDQDSKEFVVTTNPDTIVELPAEQFTTVIMTPGLWPSILGKLVSHVQLDDYSTGLKLREDRFAKLAKTENEPNLGGVGTASVLSQECGYMFVSSGMNNQETQPQKGRVLQYFQNNGTWTYIRAYTSPADPSLGGVRFGQSLAVSCRPKRGISTLLIGEPSINRVYRYVSTGSSFGSKQFLLDGTLTVPEAHRDSHRFGYSLAIDNEVLIIGAPGLEAIYIYKQIYDVSSSTWTWSNAVIHRSSDFDYDIVTNGQVLVHRQDFGHSVAISGRTIIVGAPFADYQNLGRTDVVENYDSEGVSIRSIAKGKVYMFYSAPSVDRLCLNAKQVLSQGQFRLIYEAYGGNMTTDYLYYNSTSTNVYDALSALGNLDDITVTRSEQYFNVPASAASYGAYEYCWTVTYHTPSTQPGRLIVEWFDTGCTNCTKFDYDVAADHTAQFSLTTINGVEEFHEVNSFSAVDGSHGDRFGWSVAIDDNQLVIGAPYSSSLTSTSWDFEAGELLGWSRTGNAFDFQPTFGDNAKYRASYGQHDTLRSQFKTTGSGLRGRYYLSTFDKHPDEESFPAGSVQGVAPTGTLSSDVFLILGDKISFLIGGGCDIYRVYVELFIDGFSVAKVTGRCSETMLPGAFDVSRYRNRAAQLRVVDNSTDAWGFIIVDDFRFDWAVDGAVVKNTAGRPQHGGRTEAIMSGAAYLYLRIANDMLPCSKALESNCHWIFERKLLPSDKREKVQFGYQVAVIDQLGLVAVSAPFAQLMLSYKDTPTAHPHVLSLAGESSGAGLQYPVQPHNMTRFLSVPSVIPQASGSSGVWQLMKEQRNNPEIIANSGAVYIYTSMHGKLGYTGQKAINSSWFNTEIARIQPADLEGGDAFGISLTSSRELGAIIVGAPGFSTLSNDQGAAYYYKLEFASVRFEQVSLPRLNYIRLLPIKGIINVVVLLDIFMFA